MTSRGLPGDRGAPLSSPSSLRLVDSHAHLDMAEFDADRAEVVRRSRAVGVVAILCPADLVQAESFPKIATLAAEFPTVLAAAGIHPHQAHLLSEGHIHRLGELAGTKSIRAVGEIGLDFHYDFSPRPAQIEALRRQLAAAKELGLPAIVHSRLSGGDVIASVDAEGFDGGGVLHCFTEDWRTAQAMIDRGFLISFSGILTFPKAEELRAVAARVPLDRLLVETDSPYLAPVPYRASGRRNEPAWVVETARVLAAIKGLALDELAEATTANFTRLFPFEKPAVG